MKSFKVGISQWNKYFGARFLACATWGYVDPADPAAVPGANSHHDLNCEAQMCFPWCSALYRYPVLTALKGLQCLTVLVSYVAPLHLFNSCFSQLGSPLPGHGAGCWGCDLSPVPLGRAHTSALARRLCAARLMKWRDHVLLALKWKQSLWNLRASLEM